MLRGSTDRTLSDSIGVTFVDLRGEESFLPPVTPPVTPPVAAVQPPQVAATQPVASTKPVASTQPVTDPFVEPGRGKRTVTLIKGGARSEVVFDTRNESHGDDAVTSTREGPEQE